MTNRYIRDTRDEVINDPEVYAASLISPDDYRDVVPFVFAVPAPQFRDGEDSVRILFYKLNRGISIEK